MIKFYKFVMLSIGLLVTLSVKAYDSDMFDYARYGRKCLRSADLSCAPLFYGVFNNCDLKYSRIVRARFKGADLKESDLSYAKSWLTDFEDADLEGAILYKIEADRAYFENANLTNADMRDGDFSYAKFTKGTIFNGAKLEDANFAHCKGLSNEQKDYLRQQRALNVPANIYYEIEDNSEKIGTESKDKDKFFRRIYLYFYRKFKRIKKRDMCNQACAPFPEIVFDSDGSEVGIEVSQVNRSLLKKLKNYFKKYKNSENQTRS